MEVKDEKDYCLEMEGAEVLNNLEEKYSTNQQKIGALAEDVGKEKIRQLNCALRLKLAVNSLHALDVIIGKSLEDVKELKLNLPKDMEDCGLPNASPEMGSRMMKTLSELSEGVEEFFKEEERENREIVEEMAVQRIKLREWMDKTKAARQRKYVKVSIPPPLQSDPAEVLLNPIEYLVAATVGPRPILKRPIPSSGEGERQTKRVVFAEVLTQVKFIAPREDPEETCEDAMPVGRRRSARLQKMNCRVLELVDPNQLSTDIKNGTTEGKK